MRRPIRTAIVTTDDGLLEYLRAELTPHPRLELALEVATPLADLSDRDMRAIRERNPELVLLDLSRETSTAIEFARFLTEHNHTRRIIGIGPDLGAEMLITAMRAGVGEYLRAPVTTEELAGAIERVLRLLVGPSGEPDRVGKVITLFAVKGGEGTTTIAINLAIELHRLTSEPTLLVDLDVELGEISLLLGLEPRYSVIDLARNLHRLDPELLGSYVQAHDSGVHVLGAPVYPATGEVVGADAIHTLIAFLRRHYAFIVVDADRPGAPHSAAALERADRVVALTQLGLSSLRNMKRCGPLLDRVGLRSSDRMRLVINRYDPSSAISLREVEDALEHSIHCTLCDDRDALDRATLAGKPLVLHAPSALGRQIRELAANLADVELEPGAKGSGFIHALAAPLRRMKHRAVRAGGSDRR